ncbi:MAG: type II secretion system protein [bacterium]
MKAVNQAFTLIELLIVVAIIGILAAIAVPNFLNAQTRAKIARVQGEFRSIATALESYHMDTNFYPPWRTYENGDIWPVAWRLRPLTTPVAYMSSVPYIDPFVTSANGITREQPHSAYEVGYNYGEAYSSAVTMKQRPLSADWRCSEWRIESAGPDGIQHAASIPSYESSNGLNSLGDIQRLGPRTAYPCDASLVGK